MVQEAKWRKQKRMGLLSICKKVIKKSHGLAFVPVDRNKFNFFRKRYSGILTHRPFTIRKGSFRKFCIILLRCWGIRKYICHLIRPYQVMGIVYEEAYLDDHISLEIESAGIYSHDRKGLGAPIAITGEDCEAKAVGAITLGNNQQILLYCFHRLIGHGYLQVGNFWLV